MSDSKKPDLVFHSGCGVTGANGVHLDPGSLRFMTNATERMRIDGDGSFYVNGEKVTTSQEVYNGFRAWLEKEGVLHQPTKAAEAGDEVFSPELHRLRQEVIRESQRWREDPSYLPILPWPTNGAARVGDLVTPSDPSMLGTLTEYSPEQFLNELVSPEVQHVVGGDPFVCGLQPETQKKMLDALARRLKSEEPMHLTVQMHTLFGRLLDTCEKDGHDVQGLRVLLTKALENTFTLRKMRGFTDLLAQEHKDMK